MRVRCATSPARECVCAGLGTARSCRSGWRSARGLHRRSGIVHGSPHHMVRRRPRPFGRRRRQLQSCRELATWRCRRTPARAPRRGRTHLPPRLTPSGSLVGDSAYRHLRAHRLSHPYAMPGIDDGCALAQVRAEDNQGRALPAVVLSLHRAQLSRASTSRATADDANNITYEGEHNHDKRVPGRRGASKPARFSRLSPARALSLLTGGPRPPFLATAATRAERATRAETRAETRSARRASVDLERPRVRAPLHVGRAPGLPVARLRVTPRAPSSPLAGQDPPRPAARLWSTKKTPVAPLDHLPRACTPPRDRHPHRARGSVASSHERRLQPPHASRAQVRRRTSPVKLPRTRWISAVPSVGGATGCGRAASGGVSESAPSFPSRSTPRRSTSSSPLPSSPLDSGRRRRRARWRRSGRSPP